MKRAATLIAVCLMGVALVAIQRGSAETDAVTLSWQDAEIVALGADVYVENCASCHGADLAGQPDWRVPGPDGRLPAPPHDATGHTWHHDSETLFELTKFGLAKMINDPDYETNMPSYEGKLTDAEIIAVLSYIKSTWPADIRASHDQREITK